MSLRLLSPRLATITLAFVMIASTSPAQAPTPPNVDPAKLSCRTDTLAIFLVRQGVRQQTGTVIDECHPEGSGAARVRMRIYISRDAVLGNRVDTVIDSWTSLEPRSYHSVASHEIVRLDWLGSHLRGRIETEGKAPVAVDEQLRSRVYNGASFDTMIEASPLAANYAVEIPAYVPGRGVVTLTAKVVGEEMIDGQASWRVDADFTGLAVTFWIAKSSRRLLKQVLHAAPGTDIEFIATLPRSA